MILVIIRTLLGMKTRVYFLGVPTASISELSTHPPPTDHHGLSLVWINRECYRLKPPQNGSDKCENTTVVT